MGNRGNIVIGGDPTSIYFYTHWTGYKLPILLQHALKIGKDRWDDSPYLNRVIFQTMLEGNKDIIGYGISIHPQDNEYPFLVVNEEKVYLGSPDDSSCIDHGPWTFEEYLDLNLTINNCWQVLTGDK